MKLHVALAAAVAWSASGHITGGDGFVDLIVNKKPSGFDKVVGKRGGKGLPEGEETTVSSDACYLTSRADSSSNKAAKCPKECPFYAQDRRDPQFCTFACVKAEDCARYNPNKPIGDPELGSCRGPMVQVCEEYVMDGETIDKCRICASGYMLGEDGQCHYELMYVIYLVAGIVGVIVLGLVAWFVDMALRPAVNQEGLDKAVDFVYDSRNKMKNTQPPTFSPRHVSELSAADANSTFPLTTNMCTTNVAGPGVLLHMNFQAVLIGWALFVAATWSILAYVIDNDLFILGTRKFGTPRENCILVAWGYETQQELLWVKRLFLWIVYIVSFLLCMLHGVRQLRLYQAFDREEKTMKDFVAVLKGLPAIPGSRLVENELKTAMEAATNCKVAGVSVAWNFKENEDQVGAAIQKEINSLEEGQQPSRTAAADDEDEPQGLRGKLYKAELGLFAEEDDENDVEDLKIFLSEMTTSDTAYVVFETENDRDTALEKLEETGLEFEGAKLTLKYAAVEPGTVKWVNYDCASSGEKTKRVLQGCGMILLALLFWVTVFYGPYAWSIAAFNYDNGQEPGAIYGIAFSLVVTVGNVIMYEVCNQVSELIGFTSTDDKEAAYMVFYTIACTFNICVDMLTTYYMAYTIMSELGFRTYFGKRLSDVPIFPDAFETYAIQRSLAENTYLYAFPSTYLIPFVIEPFATILMPFAIGKLIVKSHKMSQNTAEEWVLPAALELGRYADLLLNVVLGMLIFYFPGGYTTGLFLAMAGSHLFIYLMDHWRILKVVPQCTFASFRIDWCSQAMLAPCCGLVVACLVFKANTEADQKSLGPFWTVVACTGAFVAHCVVHLLCLCYVVPLFAAEGDSADAIENVTFGDMTREIAPNWFNTNPVFCLRSKELYKHSPPCTPLKCGKEHLLKVNAGICQNYQDATVASKKASMEAKA